jgi:zinc-ribbon domain
MQTCPACHRALPEINRFCTYCGTRLGESGPPAPARRVTSTPEELNLNVLYGMVAALVLALLFPPWETAPGQSPEFLGMHFILSPPEPDAFVSRMLLTIELVTITIAGLYGAFLLRKK